MNKQSNAYTIGYIIVLVVVVGAALALTALGLKAKQTENANADKMRQILASAHIMPNSNEVIPTFEKCIKRQFLIDQNGQEVSGSAFDLDMAKAVKESESERKLPVFVCDTKDGEKYIIPVYGAGLWGPIWGYLAIDSDGSTIYGAYFDHQGETPGLGAEIAKPEFCDRFIGKHLFVNNNFYPIEVVKAGQKGSGDADYVDGVTGGTITSKGVGSMIDNCLKPYKNFLIGLKH